MDRILCLWSISPTRKSSKRGICQREIVQLSKVRDLSRCFPSDSANRSHSRTDTAALRSRRVSREWISCLRHRRSTDEARPRGWLRTDSGEAARTSAETPGTSLGIDIKLSRCRYSTPRGRRPAKFTSPSLACCENSGCASHRPIRQNALGNYYFNFDALPTCRKHVPG